MTKNITDILRPFLVVLFIFGFGLLSACGGSSGGGNNTAATRVTVTPPPVTVTNDPMPLAFDNPALGALRFTGSNGRQWFVVVSVTAEVENTVLFGDTIELQRGAVTAHTNNTVNLPVFNQAVFNANGELTTLVDGGGGGNFIALPSFYLLVGFETNPTISLVAQLCPTPWLANYIRASFAGNFCPAVGAGLSYTPNMPNVLHAAMADTFHRGIGIGESRFAFSGRHNGNDRAAGFTYDMGGYALRTDYVHLPSKQDGGVFLDTYRFGIVRPINDESRFFAGFDSYDNAILALDINAENLHRFGIALGDGYAVKYELRIRL